jgi:DNA polymerase elongation subunit (family B)
VEEQMAIRLDIKKKKEQLAQQKKNCNGSQEEIDEINNQLKLYSKRDFVAKVLINSTYGVMGCKSSIMYNKAAAASTTYIGRHMLNVLKEMMEKYCDILVA